MSEETPKNCWDCPHSTIIGEEAYFGYHKCKREETGNVEQYKNRVNPTCPLHYGKGYPDDNMVFDFLESYILDFTEMNENYIKPDNLCMVIKKNKIKLTITIEEDLDLNELKKSIDSFFETKELEEK